MIFTVLRVASHAMKQLSAMVDRKLHDGFAVETETAGAAATKEDIRDESQLHRWTIRVASARNSTGLFTSSQSTINVHVFTCSPHNILQTYMYNDLVFNFLSRVLILLYTCIV